MIFHYFYLEQSAQNVSDITVSSSTFLEILFELTYSQHLILYSVTAQVLEVLL